MPHLRPLTKSPWCGPGDRKAKTRDLLRTGWGTNEKMIGPEYGFGQEMQRHHQSPVVLLKTAWGGKDVWCDFRSPSTGDFNWAEQQMKTREEREGRSREVGSFFRAMINNVKTGLNQARVHLGREDLELKGLVWFQGWNDYCQWPVEEAGSPCGRGIIERYSHNLKHMLVDLHRSIGRHHASDCDWGTWRPRHRGAKITIRLGPPCLSDRASRDCQPIGPLLLCANRRILGCPRHRSLGVPLQRFRRKLSAYGTHLCLAPAGPRCFAQGTSDEGGKQRRHANHVASLSTRSWRLGLVGLKHFPAVGASARPLLRTQRHQPGVRRRSKLGSIALRQRNSFPLQPSTILYYCGSNDVNAGKTRPVLPSVSASSLNLHAIDCRTPTSSLAINRSPEKKERWAVVDKANQLVASYCETQDGRTFVDLNQVLEADDGSTRQDMFLPDQLHLTEKAYEGFARVMREALEQQVQSP